MLKQNPSLYRCNEKNDSVDGRREEQLYQMYGARRWAGRAKILSNLIGQLCTSPLRFTSVEQCDWSISSPLRSASVEQHGWSIFAFLHSAPLQKKHTPLFTVPLRSATVERTPNIVQITPNYFIAVRLSLSYCHLYYHPPTSRTFSSPWFRPSNLILVEPITQRFSF